MENRNSYYQDDAVFMVGSCTNIIRLKRELANKQYFDDEVFCMYLEENSLDPNQTYDKDTMQKQLLQAVCDVLQAVLSNVDLMRSVQTEFSSTTQAAEHLENRIHNLQKRILAIPDVPNEPKGCISFLYHD